MPRTATFIALLCTVLSTLGSAATFRLGIDVFVKALDDPQQYPQYAALVHGRRVGLITNQTGKDQFGNATIDLLHQHPQVHLSLLFAPEHGIRGVIPAGEAVDETVDRETGLPIHSLYGANDKRPPKVVLDDVDLLVYDIQDVGSRAYTYIWSMAEAMAAAGEHGKTFIVLDRPNPLGGHTVDGPITETKWLSFIGLHPIPRVYGMTVGELARYLNAEHNLNCDLVIVPMEGYRRHMEWHDLGLHWTPPSPNIPSVDSAAAFAATGTLGTTSQFYIGIGTPYAFQVVGGAWMDAAVSADRLNSYNLPGVDFQPVSVNPDGGPLGSEIEAVLLHITDATAFYPATTELVLLRHLQMYYGDHWRWRSDRVNGFDKAMGTSSVRLAIVNGVPLAEIVAKWHEQHRRFQRRRQQYLIYQ
jgi:uncharacterized protein YbbC (DUF1343 family)